MIELHYWPTPNGRKATIMLEECGLDYTIIPVDIYIGDQFKPEFLRISPNNRMPAIVDHDPIGGGEPLSVFESGAILEYLADKTGMFLPREGAGRYRALQWVHWQMANLGPMMGNANHFKNYGRSLVDDVKLLEYGEKRFVGEVDRLAGVMDAHLSANRYLAGDEYTIADMITWPWARLIPNMIYDGSWDSVPNLSRWSYEVGGRPAVEKCFRMHSDWGNRERTEEEEQARRELFFNQDAEKVRKYREAAARSTS